MKTTYDPEGDTLYIAVRPDHIKIADNIELEPGISVDLDAEGRVLGIEIIGAAELLGRDAVTSASVQILLPEPEPEAVQSTQ